MTDKFASQVVLGIVTAALVGGSPWWVEAITKGTKAGEPIAAQARFGIDEGAAAELAKIYWVPGGSRLKIQRVSAALDLLRPSQGCRYIEVKTTFHGQSMDHELNLQQDFPEHCSLAQTVEFYADPNTQVYVRAIRHGNEGGTNVDVEIAGVLEKL